MYNTHVNFCTSRSQQHTKLARNTTIRGLLQTTGHNCSEYDS